MKQKNILLTTLGTTFNHNRHSYFSHREKNSISYCEGISAAEAGAKYILSTVPIDKIIVLGPRSAVRDENIGKDILLRDFCSFGTGLPHTYSEYKFFCYRIMQFLNQVDIEGNDVFDSIPYEAQTKLKDYLNSYMKEEPFDSFFHQCNTTKGLYKGLLKRIPHCTSKEEKWIRHYLYARLNHNYKMNSLDKNEQIKVRFLPTVTKDDNPLKMGNFPAILKQILGDDDSFVNLYVDLQGLDIADSHTIINVLFTIQNERSSKLKIQEIITTTFQPQLFTSPIENQKERLELSELLSGIDAFLQYGKVDMIAKYWQNRNLNDAHIERMLKAMRCVDIGITLSNVKDMEEGIIQLKDCFKEGKNNSTSIETMILNIMETSIKNDYGKLVEGEELDVLELVKWAIRKGFYQQALTIVESLIPGDFVKNGILFYARNEKDKPIFLEVFNKAYWKAVPKDRYQFNNLEHYFIKFYRRQKAYQKGATSADIIDSYAKMRVNDMENPDLILRTFTLYRGDKEKLIELLKSYLKIGDLRNHISHAEDETMIHMSQKEKVDLITSSIYEFIGQYEEIKKDLAPSPKPYLVDSKEFETYHMEHPILKKKK